MLCIMHINPLNHGGGLLTSFQLHSFSFRKAPGCTLFQAFPYTVIYVAKHRLKSKRKGSTLIGLCFVGKIGLVRRRVGRGFNSHKTMSFHCSTVLTKILNQPNATLDGLHLVHIVLDHLHSDLICSAFIKHLLGTNSYIWL